MEFLATKYTTLALEAVLEGSDDAAEFMKTKGLADSNTFNKFDLGSHIALIKDAMNTLKPQIKIWARMASDMGVEPQDLPDFLANLNVKEPKEGKALFEQHKTIMPLILKTMANLIAVKGSTRDGMVMEAFDPKLHADHPNQNRSMTV